MLSIRAEYAAIPLFGAKHFPTPFALVEELTGILRHFLFLSTPTIRAFQAGYIMDLLHTAHCDLF